MPAMLVTPEVSQLEMSASKLARSLKSPLMSVMPETSQLLMGPYSNSAAVTFALYSTAAARSPFLVLIRHAPRPAHPEPYAASKTVMPSTGLPSHAQRISILVSLDKELVPCRVARRAIRCKAARGPEGGGGCEAISMQGRVRLEVWAGQGAECA